VVKSIRRFKRFDEVEFVLPDHIVLAGQTDKARPRCGSGAAWGRLQSVEGRKIQRHGRIRSTIARQAFSAVPRRSFDLLCV